ncbi:MAG: galactokinase family protein, partial [Armatimonadetes bacterium]|nr:galactokinase family protein [Armatimonadota bacterium]
MQSLEKGAADEILRGIYGEDDRLLKERTSAYVGLLTAFAEQFGENNEVIISRSPGRLNLMGRHVDHRGGHVNPIA